MQTSTFWLKFGSLSPAVTLKIRSRSPKPNQLSIMTQCYIHANLFKICQTLHEISFRQETVTLTLIYVPGIQQTTSTLIKTSGMPDGWNTTLKTTVTTRSATNLPIESTSDRSSMHSGGNISSESPIGWVVSLSLRYEPPQDKTNKLACAPSEDSD